MAQVSLLTELINWVAVFGLVGFFMLVILGMIIAFVLGIWLLIRRKRYDIVNLKRHRLQASAEMSCRQGIKGQWLYIGSAGLKYQIHGFVALDWLDKMNERTGSRQLVIMVKNKSMLPYSIPLGLNKMMIRCDSDDIEGDINTITGDVTMKAIDLRKRDFYFVPVKRWDDRPDVIGISPSSKHRTYRFDDVSGGGMQ